MAFRYFIFCLLIQSYSDLLINMIAHIGKVFKLKKKICPYCHAADHKGSTISTVSLSTSIPGWRIFDEIKNDNFSFFFSSIGFGSINYIELWRGDWTFLKYFNSRKKLFSWIRMFSKSLLDLRTKNLKKFFSKFLFRVAE